MSLLACTSATRRVFPTSTESGARVLLGRTEFVLVPDRRGAHAFTLQPARGAGVRRASRDRRTPAAARLVRTTSPPAMVLLPRARVLQHVDQDGQDLIDEDILEPAFERHQIRDRLVELRRSACGRRPDRVRARRA